MTIEQREVNNMHGLAPANRDPKFLGEQMQDAIQLNNDAKLYEVRELLYAEVDAKLAPLAWKKTTLNIIQKYANTILPNVTEDEIKKTVKDVFGFSGFDQVARWVQDDMCSEVFNKMLQYCLNEGQVPKKEKGFIDGSGIGYLKTYTKICDDNLQVTFDIKWTDKMPRPLVLAMEMYGIDLSLLANKIHPGHWSYIQGHITKALSAVQTIQKVMTIDRDCNRAIVLGALIFGLGRDGNLIHLAQDSTEGFKVHTVKI